MLGKAKIFIIGAGDKGTAAAVRIFNSGFRPVLLEKNHPGDLHSFRNFSDVIYIRKKSLYDISCIYLRNIHDPDILNSEIDQIRFNRSIPLINCDDLAILNECNPDIIIDCRIKKPEMDPFDWEQYPCVIRLGPGFSVGQDGHFVIGIAGDELGRVYRTSAILSATKKENMFLTKSPLEGVFVAQKDIGEVVKEKDIIGAINDINILSPMNGILTGILHSGHIIERGQPLFEIKPERFSFENDKKIPVECLAIAGGILEAVLIRISESNILEKGV